MLTAEQKSKVGQILEANDVGAFDGKRIAALIALLSKWLPLILPYVLPLLDPVKVAEAEAMDAADAESKLTATDWQALIKLILQLIALIFPQPAPTPVPPGPVA